MKVIWWIASVTCLCGCARVQSQQKSGTPLTDSRPVIVCFGDSLTAGYGVEPGRSYPHVLQQELDGAGYRYRVVNRGVSGETTQDGLARLPQVVSLKPEIVILEFGANDELQGRPVDKSENNLTQMIERLSQAGARVVLAGITLPPNYGAEYSRQFDAMFARVAARYELPLIPSLLDGVAANPQLMQEDGLHPNTEGTRLVAKTVMNRLEPLLRKN